MVRKTGADTEGTEVGVAAATQRQRRNAIRLYQETDLTADAIASRYGVSKQSLYRWLAQAGVPKRGPMGPRSATPEAEDDDVASWEIEALRRDIASITGKIEAQHQQNSVDLEALAASVRVLTGEVHALTELLGRAILDPPPPRRK